MHHKPFAARALTPRSAEEAGLKVWDIWEGGGQDGKRGRREKGDGKGKRKGK